jgi:hypothetical protein
VPKNVVSINVVSTHKKKTQKKPPKKHPKNPKKKVGKASNVPKKVACINVVRRVYVCCSVKRDLH